MVTLLLSWVLHSNSWLLLYKAGVTLVEEILAVGEIQVETLAVEEEVAEMMTMMMYTSLCYFILIQYFLLRRMMTTMMMTMEEDYAVCLELHAGGCKIQVCSSSLSKKSSRIAISAARNN